MNNSSRMAVINSINKLVEEELDLVGGYSVFIF